MDTQKLSIFNYKKNISIYYKTSQWFILNRKDVNIILNNFINFQNIYNSNKYRKPVAVPDELFFLSLLKWHNPNYIFSNIQIMYDRWISDVPWTSPVIFNCLNKYDWREILQKRSLFIRKITPYFTIKMYKIKKILCVILIGTSTNQQKISEKLDFILHYDIIIFTAINAQLIIPEITSKAVQIYRISFNSFYISFLHFLNEPYIKYWKGIYLTTETFNDIDKLSKYNISNTKILLPFNHPENKKKFYFIKDDNDNLAFYTRNKI
jgi:hypothetical protein